MSAGYKTSKSTRMLYSPEQRTRRFMPYSYGTSRSQAMAAIGTRRRRYASQSARRTAPGRAASPGRSMRIAIGRDSASIRIALRPLQ